MGEFCEVRGDLKLDQLPDEWHVLLEVWSDEDKHYLFYLRDETFECTASSWDFVRGGIA